MISIIISRRIMSGTTFFPLLVYDFRVRFNLREVITGRHLLGIIWQFDIASLRDNLHGRTSIIHILSWSSTLTRL